MNTELNNAIAEMQSLISTKLPGATFAVSEGDDPEGTYLLYLASLKARSSLLRQDASCPSSRCARLLEKMSYLAKQPSNVLPAPIIDNVLKLCCGLHNWETIQATSAWIRSLRQESDAGILYP